MRPRPYRQRQLATRSRRPRNLEPIIAGRHVAEQQQRVVRRSLEGRRGDRHPRHELAPAADLPRRKLNTERTKSVAAVAQHIELDPGRSDTRPAHDSPRPGNRNCGRERHTCGRCRATRGGQGEPFVERDEQRPATERGEAPQQRGPDEISNRVHRRTERARAKKTGGATRQIDQRAHPLQPAGAADSVVVGERAVAAPGEHRRDRDAPAEQRQAERSSGHRLPCPQFGRDNAERKDDWDQKASRRAGTGPPDAPRAEREHVGHDDQQKIDAEPLVSFDQRHQGRDRQKMHRRIGEKAEFLIRQQRQQPYRNALHQQRAAIAGRRGRIERPVNDPRPRHEGADRKRERCRDRGRMRPACRPEADRARKKDAGENRRGQCQSHMDPREYAQRGPESKRACQRPGRGPPDTRVGLNHRQCTEGEDDPGDRIGIDQRAVHHDRCRQRDDRPAEPRRAGIAGQ